MPGTTGAEAAMRAKWMREFFVVFMIGVFGAGDLAQAQAPSRPHDKNLERLIQIVIDDAKPFAQSLASTLGKSEIRNTNREREARSLVATFGEEAKEALDVCRRNHKAEEQVSALVRTAEQIDALVYSLKVDSRTTAQWEKLRTALHEVAQAFDVREPYFDTQSADSAPIANDARRCVDAVGERLSHQLVSQCIQVSPATHPPCNAQNACSLIVDEIKRGCSIIGLGAPAFCAAYK